MKKNAVYSLVLVSLMAVTLVGCGNGTDTNTNNKDSSIEEKVDSQMVEKTNLGLTMELTGDYADCIIEDISSENLEGMLSGAFGGISINKNIDGTEVTLAQLIVTKNDKILDASVRSQFPFMFNGNVYSILATLPVGDTTSEVYEEASALQSNIIGTQLITLFLDESALPDGDSESIRLYDDANAVIDDTISQAEDAVTTDENTEVLEDEIPVDSEEDVSNITNGVNIPAIDGELDIVS